MTVDGRAVVRGLLPRRVRNWLRSPGSSIRWLWDGLLAGLGQELSVEVRPGWRLICHPAAWRTAYRAHTVDAEQVTELDAFIGACREPMLLFDIGAHFGIFSLAALHYGGERARALAVDPSPVAVRMLRRVAQRNGLLDRLAIVEGAAAAEDGEVSFVDVGVQAAGYFVPADGAHPESERTPVRAVTVDALARQFGQPTHVKIDVEGFEEEVLLGARQVLRGPAAPIIFLELHNRMVRERGLDPTHTVELLSAAGYALSDGTGREADPAALLGRDLVRVVARPRVS